ncbi:hypothetical protein [Stenotrophomonas sp. TEPEL]|uniref:hypothetical protein n=1 Tax=Stenotrophomonas sp. TEPEL TaxID=2283801 RepID=UPI001404634D|nr:hypothetical protein [Stenotrophomonas sp. TEPEL]
MSAVSFWSEFLRLMTSGGATGSRCSRKEVIDLQFELNKLKKRVATLERAPNIDWGLPLGTHLAGIEQTTSFDRQAIVE